MDPENQSWKQMLKMQAIGLFGALAIWTVIGGLYWLYVRLATLV